jgi:hypothetical protein
MIGTSADVVTADSVPLRESFSCRASRGPELLEPSYLAFGLAEQRSFLESVSFACGSKYVDVVLDMTLPDLLGTLRLSAPAT